ncbi:MAG: signal peptidase II [Chitinophagaceae bacterium]|nr:signal peptidase II [Chitinophagaceae bacterium]
MKPQLKIVLFSLSTVAFIGCDRVTKDLAKTHLQFKAPVSYFRNTVRLVYVENTGAAMSFADDLPKNASFWLLSMLPLAFLLGLTVYIITRYKQMPFARLLSFALLIAGGLGNIIDRIVFDRHVTDFMIVGVGKLQTGIFNVADMCVTAGVIGLMLTHRERKPQALA